MIVILILTLLLMAYGVWEFRSHQRRLLSIPIRVHVNGTRGKSSVTRLIAATLRAGGYRTFAKVTGTLPRIIDDKGLEIPILRPHGSNIIEQIKILRYMTRRKPDAMIMECMAVMPEYQWICEHKMVRATIGVITNSRPDHLLEMGPSLENITRSLCNTLPTGGIAITAERKMFPLMKSIADRQGTTLLQVAEETVPEEAMEHFDHVEHRENVALALAVARHLGIPEDKALQGMYASHPDAGALRLYLAREEGKEVRFINALAANDPESTLTIWRKVNSIYPDPGTVLLLLNTRADRFDRSLQLLEMIGGGMKFDYLISVGEKTHMLSQYYRRYAIDPQKVVEMGLTTKDAVYRKVFDLVPGRGTVLAIGNMGAGGLGIAYYFRDRGREKDKERLSG
ncbi:MAG: poly-gamma-glutamate synthase PgsB [Candidatus Zixiibacteriota bacterium]|nr:MAG: poly-gamma-glutamate synthase PgsB [candidate division Zixibacteria bacterium]